MEVTNRYSLPQPDGEHAVVSVDVHVANPTDVLIFDPREISLSVYPRNDTQSLLIKNKLCEAGDKYEFNFYHLCALNS